MTTQEAKEALRCPRCSKPLVRHEEYSDGEEFMCEDCDDILVHVPDTEERIGVFAGGILIYTRPKTEWEKETGLIEPPKPRPPRTFWSGVREFFYHPVLRVVWLLGVGMILASPFVGITVGIGIPYVSSMPLAAVIVLALLGGAECFLCGCFFVMFAEGLFGL